MSFVSTYNSLSVRDWQQSGTNVYGLQANLQSNGATLLECTYNGCVVVGVSTANLTIINKAANNQLSQVYTDNTVSQPSGLGINYTNGNRIAIGFLFNDSNGLTNNGELRFYSNRTGSWTLNQTFRGTANLQRLGTDVAMNGNGIITYVLSNDDANGTGNISQYNYNTSTNLWTFSSNISIPSFADQIVCDSTGNVLVITTTNSGFVNDRLAIYDSGNWSNFTSPDPNISFTSLEINSYGNKVIASLLNGNTVYYYTKSSNTWSQTSTIPAPNVGSNIATFGEELAFDDDANTVVIYGPEFPASNANIFVYEGIGGNFVLSQQIVLANSGNFVWGIGNIALSNTGTYMYFNGRNTSNVRYTQLYIS